MRSIISSVLFILASITVLAQAPDSIPALNNIRPGQSFSAPLQADTFPKYNYGFEVGSSVFTDFDGGFGFNTYVAPNLSLKPAKKTLFGATAFIGRSNYYDMPVWIYPGITSKINQNFTNIGLTINGTYFVNDKLYVGGHSFVEHWLPEQNAVQPSFQEWTNYGGGAYSGYKFSDNFKVEFGFQMSKYPTFPGTSNGRSGWGAYPIWPNRVPDQW